MRNLEGKDYVSTCVRLECGVIQLFEGQGSAVNVFIKEPVHLLVACHVHFSTHVLLDHGFELLGRGRLARIGLDEILHRFLEALISRLTVPHHHANHVENIGALGIDQVAGNVESSLAVVQPVAHSDRPNVNRPVPHRILLHDGFPLVLPEVVKFLLTSLPVCILEKQRSGEIREPLAHPLIAIGIESDQLAPPLVSHFMRSHHFPIASITPVQSQLVPHRAVVKGTSGQPHELWPGLAVVANTLLCHREALER